MIIQSPSRNGKLLIIDDEEDLREVLTAILEDSAGQIDTAANGIEGIEKLKSNHYDAILSDEKMPKKSGLEVLKWMRENNINTPFIMHTGYGQKDIIQEAQKLGVFALIDKPWNEKKLIETVKTALQTGTATPK
ncbi:response regulator [Bdellovibrio sp. HCB274]|uniref:response regulator n=1 Tax=Bdellovibrio sp. HCB274 TaxID=3394361 RepID=UPI0039B5BEE7